MASNASLLGTSLALPSDENALDRMTILDVYMCVTGLSADTHPAGTGHFYVRCPVKGHRDEHPSCLLNRGNDSWKCFSCGAKGGKLQLVIAAELATDRPSAAEFLRPRAGRTFQAAPQPLMKPNQTRGSMEKLANERLVGTYPYPDEKGQLIYQCLRYEGTGQNGGRDKRFVLRAPDPTAPSGWKYNLSGIRRVPYRLPELVAARNDPEPHTIVVVEGEKLAETIAAMNIVVTTNAGGWGYDWPLSWAKYFAGAPVIILMPDADAPGRKAMTQRETLLKGSGFRVVIADLYPDRVDGSDAEDWMKENKFSTLNPEQRRKKLIAKLSGYCQVQKKS